jgi:hypothetical protein
MYFSLKTRDEFLPDSSPEESHIYSKNREKDLEPFPLMVCINVKKAHREGFGEGLAVPHPLVPSQANFV